MSRGHGALERFIKETVDEYKHVHLYLAARKFYELPDDALLEKRHKVSVLRAAKSLAARYGYYVAEAMSTQTFGDGVCIRWHGMHISTEPLLNRKKQKDFSWELGISQPTVSRRMHAITTDDDGYQVERQKILGIKCQIYFPPESN